MANSSSFKNQAGNLVEVELNADGSLPINTEGVDVVTDQADGVVNTTGGQAASAFNYGFNGTTWDRLRTAITTATSTFTGLLNVIPLLKYNATPPTLTDGQVVMPQGDSTGAQIMNPKPLARTIDSVTNYPTSCESTIVDLATDADVTVTASPAILLGYYIDTVMSAHVALIKDSTTTRITIPASTAAGVNVPLPAISCATNITVESDNSATGKVTIFWRAA